MNPRIDHVSPDWNNCASKLLAYLLTSGISYHHDCPRDDNAPKTMEGLVIYYGNKLAKVYSENKDVIVNYYEYEYDNEEEQNEVNEAFSWILSEFYWCIGLIHCLHVNDTNCLYEELIESYVMEQTTFDVRYDQYNEVSHKVLSK
jgi:hypothetical protein